MQPPGRHNKSNHINSMRTGEEMETTSNKAIGEIQGPVTLVTLYPIQAIIIQLYIFHIKMIRTDTKVTNITLTHSGKYFIDSLID